MKKTIIGFAIPVIALAAGAAVWLTGPCCHESFTVQNREELAIEKESKAKIQGATEYYNTLRSDLNTGKIDFGGVVAVREQLAKHSASRAKMGSWLTWKEMGPDNVGGRTRGIVIDKDNNNIIYAGGVSGGFWKSTNGGGTWKRTGGLEIDNINISHIVQAANGDLYYSTGEGGYTYSNADGNSGFHGGGVFKSTDRGETFQLLSATKVTSASSHWRNVHRLAADPVDPNRIYAGTESRWWVSDDAGQTWKQLPMTSSVNQGKDMVISPDGNTIFAVIGSSAAFQLWKSTDRGKNFERVDPSGSVISSSSSSFVIAMAPSNPDMLYLSSAKTDGSLKAVYRSEDNGETWTVIGTGGTFFNPLANQGHYDHCIVVDPKNQDRIFIGGLNVWEGKKIGNAFQFIQLTNWSTEFFVDNSRNPYYVHADQHIFVFEKNKENPALYIGSDGGVSKSVDITYTSTPTFFNSDYGYSTVQFYGIAVSAYDKQEVIGGTQDNGILLVNKEGITLLNADKIRAGDGGFCEISKINPNVYFGEYIYGDLYRSFNKGKNWSNFVDANVPAKGQPRYPFISIFSLWESFNDPNSPDTAVFIADGNHAAGSTIYVRSRTGYMMPVVLDAPLAPGDTLSVQDVVQSRFFMGANGSVWVSRDAINPGGQPVFFRLAALPGFEPHDIKHSQDGNTVFVSGAEGASGVVYRITNVSGKKFEYTQAGTFNPADYGIETKKIFSQSGQVATGIGVDENDANHVIVVLGGYGKTSHVFRSKNAMDDAPAFSDISGNLPDFPVYDALINMKDADEYLIAGEYGVWSSRNGGTSWNEENEGMERVPAFMLRQVWFGDQSWGGPVFYVGTHGRGVFMSETVASGIEDNGSKPGKSAVQNLNMFPNPARDVTNVSLALDKASNVTIRVFDLQGKVIRTEAYNSQPAGERNYKVNTSGLPQGTYLVNVSAGEHTHTGKLLITR